MRKLSRPNETVFNVISSASLSLEERQLQRRMRFKEKRKQKKKEKKLKKREEAEDVGVVNPDVPLENRPPLSLDLGSMFEKLLKVRGVILSIAVCQLSSIRQLFDTNFSNIIYAKCV